MSLNRRRFLESGAIAAAMAAVPRPLMALIDRVPEPVPPIDDPRLAALAARALEAARSSGAVYADIRLTHMRTRRFFPLFVYDEEDMEVGLRALVDGYWGFASGPVWSPDEMARLGREAVHQSKANAIGRARDMTLAPTPAVDKQRWVMPVQIDPFERSPFEIQDHLMSLQIHANHLGAGVMLNNAVATVQEKAFASTIGSYCTQRCYAIAGDFVARVKVDQQEGQFALDCLSDAGMGWELYAADRLPRVRDHSLREEIRRAADECRDEMRLPLKPVDVGRYDTVFDAMSMASLLDATLGRATELDRAMGYEANAGGTSYLNDPLGMRGTYQAGASLLNVTGNRSEVDGAATVKWDDEGVMPDDFTLVRNGVLTDFQTTRESAGWIGKSNGSHGCANAPSGVYAPMLHSPNLMLAAGSDSRDFETLVSGVSDGIAVKDLRPVMDFQRSSGLGLGRLFVIKGGKRVAQLPAAGLLFRSSELWKALAATGGGASLRRYGMSATKGEPPQTCSHSVTAPPAIVKGLTLIDSLRKA